MNKIEAFELILATLTPEDIAIFCNGVTSREGYMLGDRPRNFYMLASMGHASTIGLGLASVRDEWIYVFDGDGNVLMNPPVMIASEAPARLVHVVFDNGVYETTGNQPTMGVDLAAMAAGMGYASTCTIDRLDDIGPSLARCRAEKGPHFLVLRIERGGPDRSRIVPMAPQEIASRFAESLREGK